MKNITFKQTSFKDSKTEPVLYVTHLVIDTEQTEIFKDKNVSLDYSTLTDAEKKLIQDFVALLTSKLK